VKLKQFELNEPSIVHLSTQQAKNGETLIPASASCGLAGLLVLKLSEYGGVVNENFPVRAGRGLPGSSMSFLPTLTDTGRTLRFPRQRAGSMAAGNSLSKKGACAHVHQAQAPY